MNSTDVRIRSELAEVLTCMNYILENLAALLRSTVYNKQQDDTLYNNFNPVKILSHREININIRNKTI